MIFACKNRREYLALALLTFTFVTVPFNKSSWDWLASLGNFLLLLLCFVYKHVFIHVRLLYQQTLSVLCLLCSRLYLVLLQVIILCLKLYFTYLLSSGVLRVSDTLDDHLDCIVLVSFVFALLQALSCPFAVFNLPLRHPGFNNTT